MDGLKRKRYAILENLNTHVLEAEINDYADQGYVVEGFAGTYDMLIVLMSKEIKQ